MPAWSELPRQPLVQSLVLSASIHLALLAFVQPWRGTDGPQTLVINARLQPSTTTEPPPPAEPVQAETPTKPVVTPVATRPPDTPPPQREALNVPKPAPIQMPAPPLTPPAQAQTPEIAASAPDTPVKVAVQDTTAANLAKPLPAPTPRPALSIPSPVDTTWYLARHVDSHPKAIGSITPKYPDLARQRGQEGSLKLMVKIDDLGQVRDVEVVEASPPGVFDEAALEAFRNARFQPAMKEGQPVRYEAYMRVEFKLE